MENNMEVSQKTKIELPYDPSNSTSGYISEENENVSLKRLVFSTLD